MNYQVTIFDINENPMAGQPVDLLQNGQVLAQATTDPQGVASFPVSLANFNGLAVRSNPTPVKGVKTP